jgi:hypothetical protein
VEFDGRIFYKPKLMNPKLLLTVVGVLVQLGAFAQHRDAPQWDSLASYFLTNPAEKIYIHSDRDVYAQNDTLWYKVYLYQAHTGQLSSEKLRNVYVELIDEQKNIRVRNMLAVQNGVSFGDFNLHKQNLRSGKYLLRAYTEYQTNFGSTFYFEKPILLTSVYETKTYSEIFDSIQNKEVKSKGSRPEIDLQFLLEGGVLTYDLSNHLAFKVLSERGLGVEVKGRIFDQNNAEVLSFETEHRGMGRISFKPERGKTYYAKLEGSDRKYELPIAADLILMSVTSTPDNIAVRLRTSQLDVEPVAYHLVVSARGLVSYHVPVLVNSPFKTVHIPTLSLNAGVNQITLLDSLLRPLRDRLVFVWPCENVVAQVDIDKNDYAPRDRVEVVFQLRNADGTPLQANCSASVTDCAQAQSLQKFPSNIQTSMLLESDLKGTIEDPGYYFGNPNDTVLRHLDLLLLAQGWRSYIWNDVSAQLPTIRLPKQTGIELSGALNTIILNKRLKNTQFTMSLMQDDQQFYETFQTDDEGRFSISGLFLPDTLKAYFACPTLKNRKQRIEVQTFISAPPLFDFPIFKIPNPQSIKVLTEKAIGRYQIDKAANPADYDVLLDEVTIKKLMDPKYIKDDHFRPYSISDYSFKPGLTDESYDNVLYYISRTMPRVKYSGESLYISGISRDNVMPLLLLDGISVDLIDLEVLSMSTVDKVEVISESVSRNMWPSDSPAQLGGVISVFTKRFSAVDELEKSTMTHVLRGYASSRKFYSPNYSVEKSTRKEDDRATLLWAPFLVTDETGTIRFEYFNSDRRTNVQINIEGISNTGAPVVVQKKYRIK